MMNVADVSSRLKPIINTLNRFSAALLLLAIVWLCWSAARLLWLLLAAPLAPVLPLAPLQSTANSSADHSGLFAIFADPDPIAAPVQPPPNVLLKGVLIAIPESLSSAMLDVNGEVKNYRIGDTLKDSDYTLVAVDWNEVIIADAYDKEVVIRMSEAMPLDQSAMLAGAVSNQRLPDNNMLPNLSNAPMPEQGNPEMQPNGDASNDSVPQSPIDEAVAELQSNPASYLSRMGVMASGESYQVTAAMPAKLRNRLGLEPGDKVLTVNGQSVGSNPGQDANVLQQVKQSGEAQIEVQRGDQVITIRQQF
nr:type II secretion system protein N [uncultured Psychrobacter sp.]